MDGYTYLMFSANGELAGFGALPEADTERVMATLSGEADGGRVEIWQGDELVTVVGAPATGHEGLL